MYTPGFIDDMFSYCELLRALPIVKRESKRLKFRHSKLSGAENGLTAMEDETADVCVCL